MCLVLNIFCKSAQISCNFCAIIYRIFKNSAHNCYSVLFLYCYEPYSVVLVCWVVPSMARSSPPWLKVCNCIVLRLEILQNQSKTPNSVEKLKKYNICREMSSSMSQFRFCIFCVCSYTHISNTCSVCPVKFTDTGKYTFELYCYFCPIKLLEVWHCTWPSPGLQCKSHCLACAHSLSILYSRFFFSPPHSQLSQADLGIPDIWKCPPYDCRLSLQKRVSSSVLQAFMIPKYPLEYILIKLYFPCTHIAFCAWRDSRLVMVQWPIIIIILAVWCSDYHLLLSFDHIPIYWHNMIIL